uniref:Uncharacterized protein n=1 Tax=Anguilla anguilla TaxID=7936 RepID=A0A0E9X092_ANGAN
MQLSEAETSGKMTPTASFTLYMQHDALCDVAEPGATLSAVGLRTDLWDQHFRYSPRASPPSAHLCFCSI